MEKVKKLRAVGLSIPSAVKEALGMTIAEFAAKHGIPSPNVSATINGGMRPTDRIVAAFISELGGTEQEWRELLWLAGKPQSAASA